MKYLAPFLAAALVSMPVAPAAYGEEDFSIRAFRSYAKSMAILEECELTVPEIVYVRLLDYGKDLEARMQIDEATAVRIANEERAAFDAPNSTCDQDDDDVAAVLGFVQEQSVIVGSNSGLGIRDEEAIKILGGLFVSVAIIEICMIELDKKVAAAIGAHALELEQRLGMTATRAEEIYQRTLSGMRISAPDCTPNSADREPLEAMIAEYSAAVTVSD